MTAQLNEEVVQRVNDLGATTWSGTTYRHTSAGRDPVSGEGARRFGGRWNPRGIFPTIYLAQPIATCMAELDRAVTANNSSPEITLTVPHELHTIDVTTLDVLDLRALDKLQYVGLTPDDLGDRDWTACQSVGHAAWFLHMGGIVAPSATGDGLVITVFENRLRPGQIKLQQSKPLDIRTYRAVRAR